MGEDAVKMARDWLEDRKPVTMWDKMAQAILDMDKRIKELESRGHQPHIGFLFPHKTYPSDEPYIPANKASEEQKDG